MADKRQEPSVTSRTKYEPKTQAGDFGHNLEKALDGLFPGPGSDAEYIGAIPALTPLRATGRSRCSKLDPFAASLDMDQGYRPTAARDGALHFDPKRDSNIEVACLPERNLVFVVDDDAMMLRSVARLLRQLGYKSVLFPSAEAFANHSDFDGVICVLVDINLGDVSGIELRHRLKETNSSVPVIYITGNDSPAVRRAAHESGCLAYLTKPFSAKSLMEPLHRAATGLA